MVFCTIQNNILNNYLLKEKNFNKNNNKKKSISDINDKSDLIPFLITNPEKEMIVSFGPNINTIIVLTKSGIIYQAAFEPSLGGECKQIYDRNLMQKDKNEKLEENKF